MVDLIKKELGRMYDEGKIIPVNDYEHYTHGLYTYHLKEIQNNSLRTLQAKQK